MVSSRTSAKQLDKESDAPLVGYGVMLGESLLGVMAVLACTAGFVSRQEWLIRYESWQAADNLGSNIATFITGTTLFLSAVGLSAEPATVFVSVLVVSFALTSLDSATRLLRYNVTEISETLGLSLLGNRYVASVIAVVAIWFFAFFQVGGEFAGLILWQLFGTTNQLMAALALLAITIYLLRRGKPIVFTAIPMALMLASTLSAMASNLVDFWQGSQWMLVLTGGTLFLLAVWFTLEAWFAVRRFRRQPAVEGLEVNFDRSK